MKEYCNERRKEIKVYWNKIADNLKQKPKEFFKISRPFLSNKDREDVTRNIKIKGTIETGQIKVAEELANY